MMNSLRALIIQQEAEKVALTESRKLEIAIEALKHIKSYADIDGKMEVSVTSEWIDKVLQDISPTEHE